LGADGKVNKINEYEVFGRDRPDAMFAGKEGVVNGIFAALDSTKPQVLASTA
jgi:hypothetical protein